ncbi:ABC transporter permease [Segnochrobactrum spirostomi]|uniref:ABC transporter permease n=1 Tax=Segnochrobactrum spirostomi TaxID=2608987 RepID=A0A6A7YB27_9HYPH|nr:ABC transporter permease [Segnochrobactrum spirostomi]MQT14629.1 ABC transporter permease [Segnochrobactrum spirostomi]
MSTGPLAWRAATLSGVAAPTRRTGAGRRFAALPAALRRLPWTGYVALAGLALYTALALAAPLIARYSPTDVFVGGPFDPPSADFWLGTDALGRDVASRVLFGGRTVLVSACSAAALSALLGGALGLLLGIKGGLVDEIAMRALEIVMSIPPIIFALLIVGIFGSSLWLVVATVGLLFVPNVTRVTRAATLALVAEDFVAAARARGEGTLSIAFHELMPNIAGTILVEFSIRSGFAVLFIGGLGFLGFGAAPPSPDWGLMINESRGSLDSAIWPVAAPAIGIAVLVVCVNLFTDALLRVIGPDARRGTGA